MTQKISPPKESKLLYSYLVDGLSQTETANKLHINQSTVSEYISHFKSLVEQQGLKAAAKEHGIMDEIDALHIFETKSQEKYSPL